MSWTDEDVEIVKTLWQKGQSASQIAGALGKGRFTRNAVIGKIHRIGLTGRGKVPGHTSGGPPRKVKLTPHFSQPKTKSAAIFKTEPLPKEDTPPAKLIALHELEDHHCRWRFHDPKSPEFGFCGGAKVIGLPYCETHVRRAFVPAYNAAGIKRLRYSTLTNVAMREHVKEDA